MGLVTGQILQTLVPSVNQFKIMEHRSIEDAFHYFLSSVIITAMIVTYSWVKVFKIIPEFRILRLTEKVSLKVLNSAGNKSFSD